MKLFYQEVVDIVVSTNQNIPRKNLNIPGK
jgi:hypothetical protein